MLYLKIMSYVIEQHTNELGLKEEINNKNMTEARELYCHLLDTSETSSRHTQGDIDTLDHSQLITESTKEIDTLRNEVHAETLCMCSINHFVCSF